MNSTNSEVAILGRQTLGLKAVWWEGGVVETDAVPVVADSRSEELTDGQETPFLPPSATSRLGCPTKAPWAENYSHSPA